MSVGTCCQREPLKMAPEASVREAAKQMELQGAGCVVVVDEEDRPVGILTDRDVVLRVVRRELDPDQTSLADVMEREVETIRERTPVTTAIRRMRADAVRRLPVVDGHGRVVGVFHWSHALGLVADELRGAARVAAAQSQA